jgi:hypothetical protein
MNRDRAQLLKDFLQGVVRSRTVVRRSAGGRDDRRAMLRKQYDDYGRIIREASIKVE